MNGDRASRWLIWSGPLFAVVFIVLSFGTGSPPGNGASAAKVMAFYHDHRGGQLASALLAPLGAALLVLFAAQVRMRARALRDGTTGPTVLLAGAVLWGAGLLLGSSITLAQVGAADKKQAEAGLALNQLSNASWIPFIAGVAVFLIGAGMTGLGTALTPKWLAWAALVVGVVSLAGPGGFLGFFGAPVWILITGITLAIRAPARSSTPEPLVAAG